MIYRYGNGLRLRRFAWSMDLFPIYWNMSSSVMGERRVVFVVVGVEVGVGVNGGEGGL